MLVFHLTNTNIPSRGTFAWRPRAGGGSLSGPSPSASSAPPALTGYHRNAGRCGIGEGGAPAALNTCRSNSSYSPHTHAVTESKSGIKGKRERETDKRQERKYILDRLAKGDTKNAASVQQCIICQGKSNLLLYPCQVFCHLPAGALLKTIHLTF